MSETVFSVDGLSIEHLVDGEGELLVEDFDLEVRAGQIVGLVGETGAGKSLSAMASVGLLARGVRPAAGWVSFEGQRAAATDVQALQRHLGHGVCLLFQNARGALNPFMRIRDQLDRALGLKQVPFDDRPERSTQLLLDVGLSPGDIGPKYAHQISGGQAQRVAMAIALATEPRLLIADEPTTALDVTTERELIRLLQRLCRERQMSLVMIAHNLALVSQLCDHITLMHAGHVVEQGPTTRIFEAPMHPYTRGLINAIPDVDQLRSLIPLAGGVPAPGTLSGRCRFSDRCPHAWDRCRERVPAIYDREGRGVRCFLYEDVVHETEVAV